MIIKLKIGSKKMRDFVKNVFLGNFWVADKIFYLIKHLPNTIRHLIIELYFAIPIKQKSFPNRITIFLTDKCNMKCSHCFIIKDVPKKTVEITLTEYIKIFKSLKGRTSQILLTGGEPTLRMDLYEIAYNAYHIGKVSTISIFSNALYPGRTKILIENILENTNLNINFQTSLDGLKEFHNFNRKVKKSYENVISTIKVINELKSVYKNRLGRVVVGIAISKSNLYDLSEMIDELESLNCFLAFGFVRKSADVFNVNKEYINFDFIPEEFDKDGKEKFGDNYLNDDDLDIALSILEEKVWSKKPFEMIYSYQKTTLKAKQIIDKYSKSPLSVECGMGYDDLIILPNGKIARCEMLSAHSDLKKYDYNLDDLLMSKDHKSYMSKTAGCYCTHECGIGVTIMNDKKLLKDLVS